MYYDDQGESAPSFQQTTSPNYGLGRNILASKRGAPTDVAAMVRDLKAHIDTDKHGGVHRTVINHLIKAGIIDAVPESLLDPHRPCPTDWRAFQLAYFDNGALPPVRKRYTKDADTGSKREKVQRTRTRFGGNIRVWTRSKIDFSNPRQIAWQANFYCWTAGEALSVCRDLQQEGYVGAETVDKMEGLVGFVGTDPSYRFSIPLLKTTGTRWMRDHIVVTRLVDDRPHGFIVDFADQRFSNGGALSELTANGAGFGGKAVAQARLARSPDLDSWATEVRS